MSSNNFGPGAAAPPPGGQAPAGVLRRLARRIRAIIAECNDAQRRLAALSMAPDRALPGASQAPDTYADFLFRTSGPMLHELSASDRATRGRAVR